MFIMLTCPCVVFKKIQNMATLNFNHRYLPIRISEWFSKTNLQSSGSGALYATLGGSSGADAWPRVDQCGYPTWSWREGHSPGTTGLLGGSGTWTLQGRPVPGLDHRLEPHRGQPR